MFLGLARKHRSYFQLISTSPLRAFSCAFVLALLPRTKWWFLEAWADEFVWFWSLKKEWNLAKDSFSESIFGFLVSAAILSVLFGHPGHPFRAVSFVFVCFCALSCGLDFLEQEGHLCQIRAFFKFHQNCGNGAYFCDKHGQCEWTMQVWRFYTVWSSPDSMFLKIPAAGFHASNPAQGCGS